MKNGHAIASPGLQALILCGPGLSLGTFTSNPEELPKALIPIANRPMVWYPLQWCYHIGVSNITLITTKNSRDALSHAFSTDPCLTSLPLPKPVILTPEGISLNSGTADILRAPEVQSCVTGDFLALPCDLVCDLSGGSLLEAWLVNDAGLSASPGTVNSKSGRAGLGVWYDTKSGDDVVKGEPKDVLATTSIPRPRSFGKPGSYLPSIRNVVFSAPMATVDDIAAQKHSFPIRHALLNQYGNVQFSTSYRDAHIYFLPKWILKVISENENMVSLAEDVIGWWAKSRWQPRLASKLTFDHVSRSDNDVDELNQAGALRHGQDVRQITTTLQSHDKTQSRQDAETTTNTPPRSTMDGRPLEERGNPRVPPILAYVKPRLKVSAEPGHSREFLRRVDSSALLLTTSLLLAKVPALDEVEGKDASSFAHPSKIIYPEGVKKPSTVTTKDCLLADGVVVEERAVIKESVIGTGCKIGRKARLVRCVLMDGVVVGDQCQLTGCILGRRCRIGNDSVLKDCEVQETYVVPEKTDGKTEVYMSSQGYEDNDADEDLAAEDVFEG